MHMQPQVQYSAMQCNAMQYSAMQCGAERAGSRSGVGGPDAIRALGLS